MAEASQHVVDLAGIDSVIGPLVVEAGEIALTLFRSGLAVHDKQTGARFDPVTDADRRTEAFLRREIQSRFPDHEIVGEEGGTTGAPGRVRWLIDPIDGTKAFVTGVPAWGVLLGLVVDGVPVAGWARQPYLGETFSAVGRDGRFERGGTAVPLATSTTTELAAASMYTTHPSMFATRPEATAFEALAGAVRIQRFGGDFYSYCLLAAGHIDLVVEAGLQPYDIVPLIPIVEAAGGVITGAGGEAPLEGGFVVAACTRELHAAALEKLHSARP